jgi:hypothetical protein
MKKRIRLTDEYIKTRAKIFKLETSKAFSALNKLDINMLDQPFSYGESNYKIVGMDEDKQILVEDLNEKCWYQVSYAWVKGAIEAGSFKQQEEDEN